MNTLISVLGPTATGKTAFALSLADQALLLEGKHGENSGKKLFNGVDLISADSRQVYQGLEVLSGTDVPRDFIKIPPNAEVSMKNISFPFYEKKLSDLNSSVRLHGISILNLVDEWSVAHFKNFAVEIINDSFKNNRLPIIVGGTNLYINNLFNLDNNLYIKPDFDIRNKANNMTIRELQEWLESVNAQKLSQMNNSDINNARRLVRAIEIFLGRPELDKVMNLPKGVNTLKFGLVSDLETINLKIKKRVVERFKSGAIDEVKKLSSICGDESSNTDMLACSTLGASDIRDFIDHEIDEDQCLENWALHEFQYAKRQLVWLKKENDVVWLDDLTKYRYTLSNEKIFI